MSNQKKTIFTSFWQKFWLKNFNFFGEFLENFWGFGESK